MRIANGQFPSIEQVTDKYLRSANTQNTTKESVDSFADVLKNKQAVKDISDDGLRFSKHASLRLQDRNIELSDSQINRLNAGMQRANEKGINESLVLMDQMAFIVNVKNNTVITAMNDNDMKDTVFTNIDGAVIV